MIGPQEAAIVLRCLKRQVSTSVSQRGVNMPTGEHSGAFSGSTRVSVAVFQSANQQGVIVGRQLEKNTAYVTMY